MKHQKGFMSGLAVLLLTICVGLFAADADSTKLLNSGAYYQRLKEKEAAQIQRALDLQTLITALICLSEGRNETALAGLQTAGQSEYIKQFVDSQIEGGLDGLMQRCSLRTDRAEPHTCPACSGTGFDTCPHCRGLGKRKDGSLCMDCRGFGANICRDCEGKGASSAQMPEPDPDIEAVILKALYLKNGGVDLFH